MIKNFYENSIYSEIYRKPTSTKREKIMEYRKVSFISGYKIRIYLHRTPGRNTPGGLTLMEG
jgi:hypothetical protein